jgi:hypothetical protein
LSGGTLELHKCMDKVTNDCDGCAAGSQ